MNIQGVSLTGTENFIIPLNSIIKILAREFNTSSMDTSCFISENIFFCIYNTSWKNFNQLITVNDATQFTVNYYSDCMSIQ